jgi:hypothetical protein
VTLVVLLLLLVVLQVVQEVGLKMVHLRDLQLVVQHPYQASPIQALFLVNLLVRLQPVVLAPASAPLG